MNWKTPVEVIPEDPSLRSGEIQHKTIFAWVPIECIDGHTYWLQKVHVLEKWKRKYYGFRGCYDWGWVRISANKFEK